MFVRRGYGLEKVKGRCRFGYIGVRMVVSGVSGGGVAAFLIVLYSRVCRG